MNFLKRIAYGIAGFFTGFLCFLMGIILAIPFSLITAVYVLKDGGSSWPATILGSLGRLPFYSLFVCYASSSMPFECAYKGFTQEIKVLDYPHVIAKSLWESFVTIAVTDELNACRRLLTNFTQKPSYQEMRRIAASIRNGSLPYTTEVHRRLTHSTCEISLLLTNFIQVRNRYQAMHFLKGGINATLRQRYTDELKRLEEICGILANYVRERNQEFYPAVYQNAENIDWIDVENKSLIEKIDALPPISAIRLLQEKEIKEVELCIRQEIVNNDTQEKINYYKKYIQENKSVSSVSNQSFLLTITNTDEHRHEISTRTLMIDEVKDYIIACTLQRKIADDTVSKHNLNDERHVRMNKGISVTIISIIEYVREILKNWQQLEAKETVKPSRIDLRHIHASYFSESKKQANDTQQPTVTTHSRKMSPRS